MPTVRDTLPLGARDRITTNVSNLLSRASLSFPQRINQMSSNSLLKFEKASVTIFRHRNGVSDDTSHPLPKGKALRPED
jgi:hypothetical protein